MSAANVPAETAHRVLVDNLRFAATKLKAQGLKLLIEPINTRDLPGFFVNGTRQALELIAEAGADNLYLQYDVYHMQRMEGDLANTLAANLEKIAHIQIADNPGRHQPGTGEINYRWLLAEIAAAGYTGHIGLEYVPTPDTAGSLGWVGEFGFSL